MGDVFQVHDELVYEVRTQDVPVVARIIKECMENAVLLTVPLEVKLTVGSNWGEMVSLELESLESGSNSGVGEKSIARDLFGRDE